VEVIGHEIIRVVVWLAERFWVLGSALIFVVIDPVIALEKGTSTGREGSRDVEEGEESSEVVGGPWTTPETN